MSTPTTVTLKGYLGKNREVLATRVRTFTGFSWNKAAELHDLYEGSTTSREFLRLSLATRTAAAARTTWHNLVVWNPERQEVRAARLARKGDFVEVTGRFESFRFKTEDDEEREIRQFVVETFRIARLKTPAEIP
ncbi:MAG TPA: single-stranded DNA-binding protein [Thermoanaerobaculia bacterium]|jgi:single-stranded DNA-binding protein|nr:single-stranded DNA-binding protein [Thermoanaerobaculia bacterium]